MPRASTTGFKSVGYRLTDRCSNGILWRYNYTIKIPGKKFKSKYHYVSRQISSSSLISLKEKVIANGHVWKIIDYDQAIKTLEEHGLMEYKELII